MTDQKTTFLFRRGSAGSLLLTLLLNFGVAQDGIWRSFTTSDGLVQQFVRCLNQDHQGYLWIGTQGGASRFDGETFENFPIADSTTSADVTAIFVEENGLVWVLAKSGVKRYDGERFTSFTTADGLPDRSVTAILKDRMGNLWFGTKKGVSRFDGKTFRRLGTADGIPETEVTVLYEDREGRLWIGFRMDGIAYSLDPEKTKWKSLTTEDGLPLPLINDIREDRRGTLWVATIGGLATFRDGKFLPSPVNEVLPTKMVYSLLFDKGNVLWMRTRGSGVLAWDGKNISELTSKNGLAGDFVSAILVDRQGDLWIATNKGLSRYDGKHITSFREHEAIGSGSIMTLFEDREGLIWVGTSKGLSRFEQGRFSTALRDDEARWLPAYSSLRTIFKDRENNLWFPSTQGLGFFDGTEFRLLGPKDGLTGDEVHNIVQDSSGAIWIGTSKSVYLRRDVRFEEIKDPFLRNKAVLKIVVDRRGMVWFLRRDGAVILYEAGKFSSFDLVKHLGAQVSVEYISTGQQSGVWFHTVGSVISYDGFLMKRFSLEEIMPGSSVLSRFRADLKGSTWFGTDKGLAKFDGATWTRFSEKDGVPEGAIGAMFVDSLGFVWVTVWATDTKETGSPVARGVLRYDGTSFKMFTQNDGLADNDVTGFFEECKGTTWFFTANGLSRYDGSNFTNFSIRDGLAGKSVSEIARDRAGNLWIATNTGFSKFNGKSLSTVSVKDGLLDAEVLQIETDKNNRPWIRTAKGVQKYDERSIPPNIVLTRVSSRNSSYSLAGNIEIGYSDNSITMEYRGISLASATGRLQYLYRLEGYDSLWYGPVKDTKAAFRNLSPGSYRFSVKAISYDLTESQSPAEFAFTILPPFWMRPWFLGATIVSVLGILTGAYRWRTRKLRERSIQLEHMVKERTKELEAEKNKSDELLHNILPAEVIKELKEKGVSRPREYKTISILFTDFMGFTNISSTLPAERLVGELNEIFRDFDAIIEKHGLEKLKTIGDAYMIACGLPIVSDDHAVRIVKAAMEMQEYIKKRNESSSFKWQMRAGVHSGTVVAGIVGKNKFTYDVWGDTVNIASRMESACEPGGINISAFTYDLLKEHFECNYRGKIEAKGKGMVDMYNVVKSKESSAP